jgi:hypothetical protein
MEWVLHHLGVIAYFVLLAAILVSYVLFAFSRGNDVRILPSAMPHGPLPPNRVDLVVEPLAVNASSGEGEVEVLPRLVGDLGVPYGNTSQASVPIRLTIDGAAPPTEDVSADEVLAVTKPTILLGNSASITSFPFDSYNSRLFANAERTDGPSPTQIPVVFVPTPQGVSGYDIVFSGVSSSSPSASGQNAQLMMDITRDDDTQAVTVLVGVISLVSAAVVLLLTTLVVLGRKPNKIDGTVVMTAVIPFALILLRQVIPDAPPVGVDYDIYVYYSAVIVTFLSFIVCAWKWLTTRGSE